MHLGHVCVSGRMPSPSGLREVRRFRIMLWWSVCSTHGIDKTWLYQTSLWQFLPFTFFSPPLKTRIRYYWLEIIGNKAVYPHVKSPSINKWSFLSFSLSVALKDCTKDHPALLMAISNRLWHNRICIKNVCRYI